MVRQPTAPCPCFGVRSIIELVVGPRTVFLTATLLLNTAKVNLPITTAPTPATPLLLTRSGAPRHACVAPRHSPGRVTMSVASNRFHICNVVRHDCNGCCALAADKIRVGCSHSANEILILGSIANARFCGCVFARTSHTPTPAADDTDSGTPRSAALAPVNGNRVSTCVASNRFSFDNTLAHASNGACINRSNHIQIVCSRDTDHVIVVGIIANARFCGCICDAIGRKTL